MLKIRGRLPSYLKRQDTIAQTLFEIYLRPFIRFLFFQRRVQDNDIRLLNAYLLSK